MGLLDRTKKIYDWVPESKKILDLGCSTGDLTAFFLNKSKEVYGVDIDKILIAKAKKKYDKIHFYCAKGEKIPFKNNFFDIVVMGDVLEHVSDEKKTLEEVYRVLNPNGALILSVPHKGLFRFIDSFNMKFYFPKLYKLWKGKNYNPNVYQIQPWHRHYSLNDLKNLFGKKFKIKKMHRGGFIIFPLAWLLGDMISDCFGNKLKFLRSVISYLSHIEYNIPFGPFGYSIIVYAKKRV